MTPAAGTLVIGIALGLVLALLGRWALRAGGDAPDPDDPDDSPAGRHREQQRRSLRRGGWVCMAAGVLLAGAGIITFVTDGTIG